MAQETSNRPFQSNFKNPGSEQKNLQTAKAGRMKVPKHLTVGFQKPHHKNVVNHDRRPIVLQTVVVLRLQEERYTQSVHATADQLVPVWLLECHCCLADIQSFEELAFRKPVVH